MPHGDWDQLSPPRIGALNRLFHQPGATARVDKLPSVRMATWRSLKGDINTLLWASLPSSVTLGEAEQIAVEIYDLIAARWETVRP